MKNSTRQKLRQDLLEFHSRVIERERLIAELVSATEELVSSGVQLDAVSAKVDIQKLNRVQEIWSRIQKPA